MQKIRDYCKKFRLFLNEKRRDNQKVFDLCTKAVGSVWVIISALFPTLVENNAVITVFLFISFLLVFTFQWVRLSTG